MNGYQLIPSGHGNGDAANWAYFPVFPKTISIISQLLSIPSYHLFVAFVLNNIAFLFGIYVLFLYVRKEHNEKIAMTTIILMLFSPYSLYFSIPYTESFFFLFTILVFFFAISGKWLHAALMGVLLSGTKIIGVMIVFPMLIIAIKQFGFKNLISFKHEYSYKVFLSLLIAPLGLFFYMFFLDYKVGDAFAFKHVQIAWGREVSNPLNIFYNGLIQVGTYHFYMSLATILGLVLTLYILYKNKYAEFSFLIISILIPLSTSLDSIARYIFALFPIYISISLIIYKYPLLIKLLVICFSTGLSYMSIWWVSGRIFMI